jgi:rRNA processing protein Gar1
MHSAELGEVLHLARSGRLIVKLNSTCSFSKIGQSLVDRNGNRIGKIIELIGSVKAPFASVFPENNMTTAISGMKVFETGSTYNTMHQKQRTKSGSLPSRRKLYKGKRK